MRDGILCPAWQEGSTFYFYAFSNTTTNAYANSARAAESALPTVAATAAAALISKYNRETDRTIYTVDMDTGAIY
jgi:hypothetical protein